MTQIRKISRLTGSWNYLMALLLCFGLGSCGESFLFDQTREIDNENWSNSDAVTFETEISDTTRIYNLFLDIKHHKDYPKQNLYLKIFTTFPSGQTIDQVLNIDFSDTAGKPNGKCSGDYCIVPIDLQKGAYFSNPGIHKFKFEQYTRFDPLPKIKSLRFQIEETKDKR